MRALSIKQPWAHLILHCGKDVENRSWRRGFVGPCLVHAGLRVDEIAMQNEEFRALVGDAFLPRGGVVGIVEVTGCVADSDSKWFFGPYGFTLERARPLPFVPMRGALGFFETGMEP